ncbi:MAG: PIN domain-containing protein [Dehalococcoidia bacterium]
MPADLDFIDTNPFVYLFERVDTAKRRQAESLITRAPTEGAVISFQVVQEALSVLSRRGPQPGDQSQLRSFLREVLVPLWRVHPSAELYERALAVQDRYRFSFYDSLIVAAAHEAGCTRLLTEDLQHGQLIDGLRVENPFAGQ